METTETVTTTTYGGAPTTTTYNTAAHREIKSTTYNTTSSYVPARVAGYTTDTVVTGGPVVTGTPFIARTAITGVPPTAVGMKVQGTPGFNTPIVPPPLIGHTTTAPPIIEKAVIEEIPSESRIEYVPFQKKFIEYDQIERVEMIPIERVITEYEEVRRTEKVPIERLIQDYYAVEYQTEYIPRIIEEKVIDYIQQEKTWERVQYIPVETQIIHYPEAELATSQVQVVPSTYVTAGPTYTTSTVPAVTTVTTSQPVLNEVVYATGGGRVLSGSRTITTTTKPVGASYSTVGGSYVSGVPLIGSGLPVVGTTTYTTGVPTTSYTTTAPAVATYSTGVPLVGGTTYTSVPTVTETTTTYIS